MPVPQTPPDFLALVPNPAEPECDALRKALLELPQLIYLQQKYMYNDDGTLTTEYASDICTALGLIDCSAAGTTSTTTGGTGTTTGSTTTAATAIVYAVTSTNKFITVNLATGAVTVIKTGTSTFYGIAQDPGTGIIYGYVLNGSDIDFVSVNAVTGNETVIGAAIVFASAPSGLTFKSDGTLYVEFGGTPSSCATNGTLATVDKATGLKTSVGTHSSVYLSDICFAGSTLYGVGQSGCFGDKRLFSINTTTAAATLIAILSPIETEPTAGDALVYINGILWKTLITQIAQLNTGTGAVTQVSPYDSTTNGRIVGLAYNG